MLGSGTNAQPFKTVADYEAWVRRASHVPALFDQAIANMKEGAAKRIVQPKVLMVKVLAQLDEHIVEKASDSALWGPIAHFPADFSAADRARLTASGSSKSSRARVVSSGGLLLLEFDRDFVKKMKESWCLATSRRSDTPRAIVKLYGRRFTIEETFRDTKNLRFGLGLSATHIR
jgi:uncharacterized protein (DUF885 family)